MDYGDQEDPQRFEAAACAGITFFREIRRHAFVPDVFTYCREFPSCCQSARSDTRRRGVLPLPEPPLVTYYQYLDFVFVDHNLGTGRQQFEALRRPALLLRTIVVRGGDMSVYDNVVDSLSFANTRHFILNLLRMYSSVTCRWTYVPCFPLRVGLWPGLGKTGSLA